MGPFLLFMSQLPGVAAVIYNMSPVILSCPTMGPTAMGTGKQLWAEPSTPVSQNKPFLYVPTISGLFLF